VVDQLAVDVQDQGSQRRVGERPLGGSARLAEPAFTKRPDAVEPQSDSTAQLGQRPGRGAGIP
jgi:hypothetical protein